MDTTILVMHREQSGKVYIISRRGWIMLCVLVYIKQNGETQIKIGQNPQMKKWGADRTRARTRRWGRGCQRWRHDGTSAWVGGGRKFHSFQREPPGGREAQRVRAEKNIGVFTIFRS